MNRHPGLLGDLIAAALVLGVGACSRPSASPAEGDDASPAASAIAAGTVVAPGVEKQPEPRGGTTKPARKSSAGPRSFADEIADADQRIAGSTKNAEAQSNSAGAAERVANYFLARARLTGDYADYAEAEKWVARAFEIAGARDHGPFGTRASLNYTLHRLDRVDRDFALSQRGIRDNVTVSGHKLFASNLALQRGQYAECAKLLDESIALHESVSNLAAKAYYLVGMGEYEAADALYGRALDQYHGSSREPLAWLHLQLGLADLGRGRHEDALAHYRDAEQKISGWYLVDEHVAEVLYLLGKADEAKTLYLDIIERTQNPEFMDAMAGIAVEEGRQAEADEYVARAEKRYQDLTALYPEAAYGHALDHYLEFGKDNAFTVDLAEKNHRLRPNSEAKMRLAQAYLKADRVTDAKRVIEEALAAPWTTADLHGVGAEVFRKAGDDKRADEQLAKAKAIDPHAGT